MVSGERVSAMGIVGRDGCPARSGEQRREEGGGRLGLLPGNGNMHELLVGKSPGEL